MSANPTFVSAIDDLFVVRLYGKKAIDLSLASGKVGQSIVTKPGQGKLCCCSCCKVWFHIPKSLHGAAVDERGSTRRYARIL